MAERLTCRRCGAEVSGPFQPDGDTTRTFIGFQKRAGATGPHGHAWFCEPCLATLLTRLIALADGNG